MATRNKRLESIGWDTLPFDLLERIAFRLNIADVCRIRGVCREWAGILRSPQFMENYAARAHPPGSIPRWIVVYTDQMYAFVNKKWVSISHQGWRVPRRNEEEYQADCVADGAMVCVSRRSLINNNSVREVFVYNPTSKLRVDLPKLAKDELWPQWRPWAMCTGPGGTFKVVFLSFKSSDMHLFDARTRTWHRRTMPHAVQQETVEHDDFTHTATCINGVAYCINSDRSAVLMYNLDEDVWNRMGTPLTRHSRNYLLIEPQVVKGWNSPVLVAGVRKRRHPNPRRARDADDQADSVSIWLLDTKSMTWSKVCEKSCELSSYTLAGNEEEVFVIPHGSGEVMSYDLESRMWREKPLIPSHMCFSMATFSLEARF